jgi:hypothetical protein
MDEGPKRRHKGEVNGRLIKKFHKNLAYVSYSKS